MRRLGGVAALLSLIAAMIGVWFFLKERNYAADFDSELAAALQWVGLGMAFLGAAGFITGMLVAFGDEL
jgi:O-antigen/teichoic acid export membrane protein